MGQMKDMVQMEIKHNQDMVEEIKMKELMHLKEKERQKELIKQIRLMEEIEEIQQEHDREQFYHDQEQEMQIKEKEMEHERNREHNMALMHQLELMTQINLIQDTVMILDEVNLMDSNRERLIIYNLKEIEQHLDILDEIERGTAIASERADALSAKIKKLSLKPATEPVHIVMKLDNKLDTLMAIEQSTNAAIHKTERMNEKVLGRIQEKENKCSGLIPDKDA